MDIRNYKVLLQHLIFSCFLFFLTRVAFGIFNWSYFYECSFNEFTFALFYGIRFDISTTLIINTPFIVLSLLPIRNTIFSLLKRTTFFGFNFIFLCVNIIDIEFFNFIGKKITIDIFDMAIDIKDQTAQLAINYWYFLLIIFLLAWSLKKFNPTKLASILYIKPYSYTRICIIGFCILIITFIGIRGGLQMRSISPKQAYIFEKYELGNLSINASYTLLRSLNSKSIPLITFFTKEKVTEILSVIDDRNLIFKAEPIGRANVVIIIMESFSQEYIENGYAPFLDELGKRSFVIEENYANGRRSIESLPSILLGIPSITGKALTQSRFQSNKFISLPGLLKKNGYSTSFFHGGKTGTMDFDSFTGSIGIESYYGKEDYPNQTHYDGHWGIFDHFFFNFYSEKISEFKEPFFSTFFSLSSHQPYTIPTSLKYKYAAGPLKIHQSIRYADDSLKMFFKNIESKTWYKNTLFIITGDHTQKSNTKKFQTAIGKYRVPLIFFHPNNDLSKYQFKGISQHTDILASVVELLGLKVKEKALFGKSIFSSRDGGRMFNYSNGRYFLFRPPYLAIHEGGKSTPRTKIRQLDGSFDTNIESNQEVLDLHKELKALIQYGINGLIKNNLNVPVK